MHAFAEALEIGGLFRIFPAECLDIAENDVPLTLAGMVVRQSLQFFFFRHLGYYLVHTVIL